MRTLVYAMLSVGLLSGVLAVTAKAAVALTVSDYVMPTPTAKLEAPMPTANPAAAGFSGQAKAGGQQPHKRGPRRLAQQANTSAQPGGGEATVARVDRLGKCLHVFSEPSAYSKEIACIPKGAKLHITELFSKDRRWVQLDSGGWVSVRKLKTEVKVPPIAATAGWWGLSGTPKRASTARRHHSSRANYCYAGCYYPGYCG